MPGGGGDGGRGRRGPDLPVVRVRTPLPGAGGAGAPHREDAHRPAQGRGLYLLLGRLPAPGPLLQRALQAAHPHEGPLRREAQQVHGQCQGGVARVCVCVGGGGDRGEQGHGHCQGGVGRVCVWGG